MGDWQTSQNAAQHTAPTKKKRHLKPKKAFVAPAELNSYGIDDDDDDDNDF